MTELNNIFASIENEKTLFYQIRNDFKIDKSKSNVRFNYYFYMALYLYESGEDIAEVILNAFLYFIGQDLNLDSSIAIINNTYQIAVMLQPEVLYKILTGSNSNLMNINNDAAKVGALLALNYKIYNIGKLDLLRKTLFLAQNMI